MCYRIELKSGIKEIATRFKAEFHAPASSLFNAEINGFDFAPHPIILDRNQQSITTDYHWGLIPSWSKDDAIKKMTLNAKLETLTEKPAFRDVICNRCLIIATGYYEWHWHDDKGKSKEKFEIHAAEEAIFAFAGLYSHWTNPANGNSKKTFAIVTTAANRQMQYIHNSKMRMPLMLNKIDESDWLAGKAKESFGYPDYNAEIIAFAVKS